MDKKLLDDLESVRAQVRETRDTVMGWAAKYEALAEKYVHLMDAYNKLCAKYTKEHDGDAAKTDWRTQRYRPVDQGRNNSPIGLYHGTGRRYFDGAVRPLVSQPYR